MWVLFFESVIFVCLILLSFVMWSYVGGVVCYFLFVGVFCIFWSNGLIVIVVLFFWDMSGWWVINCYVVLIVGWGWFLIWYVLEECKWICNFLEILSIFYRFFFFFENIECVKFGWFLIGCRICLIVILLFFLCFFLE